MPARIAVEQTGVTLAARSRVRAAALAEAERLGVGVPPGLDHRLAGLLDLLAHHTRAVSLRELAGRRRRAYAAASGRYGAMAVIHGDQVSIDTVSGDHLASELLTLLAPLPAGPGRAVSLPSNAFESAMTAYAHTTDSSEARRVLRAAGIGGKDIERLLTIGREADSSGSIGAHRGERDDVKLIGSIAYADTSRGRYAIGRRNDRAGRSHTTIAPTDLNDLRRRLHDLLGTDARWQ
jgi:hypothetical protein